MSTTNVEHNNVATDPKTLEKRAEQVFPTKQMASTPSKAGKTISFGKRLTFAVEDSLNNVFLSVIKLQVALTAKLKNSAPKYAYSLRKGVRKRINSSIPPAPIK